MASMAEVFGHRLSCVGLVGRHAVLCAILVVSEGHFQLPSHQRTDHRGGSVEGLPGAIYRREAAVFSTHFWSCHGIRG
jgi:hypothetical protein